MGRTAVVKVPSMTLTILLPTQIFARKTGVTRMVAETGQGSFGILPRRIDCTAALTAGILTVEAEDEGERYIAIDEGVLVKAGPEVLVSVRNAVVGEDLRLLRQTVEKVFLDLDDGEQQVRSALAKMETAFIRRLTGIRHGPA